MPTDLRAHSILQSPQGQSFAPADTVSLRSPSPGSGGGARPAFGALDQFDPGGGRNFAPLQPTPPTGPFGGPTEQAPYGGGGELGPGQLTPPGQQIPGGRPQLPTDLTPGDFAPQGPPGQLTPPGQPIPGSPSQRPAFDLSATYQTPGTQGPQNVHSPSSLGPFLQGATQGGQR